MKTVLIFLACFVVMYYFLLAGSLTAVWMTAGGVNFSGHFLASVAVATIVSWWLG